jgi:hypothetical protein
MELHTKDPNKVLKEIARYRELNPVGSQVVFDQIFEQQDKKVSFLIKQRRVK